MLVNTDPNAAWAYMEIPRTGSTTVDKKLRELFPSAKAPVGKHWPCRVSEVLLPLMNYHYTTVSKVVTVRNPYSRAVSCWLFFTRPNSISFEGWLRGRLNDGFNDVSIEARPQSFWYNLESWSHVLRNETLEEDFKRFLNQYGIPGSFDLKQMNASGSDWRNRFGMKTSPIGDYGAHFTTEAIQLTQKLYLDDFHNLGYSLSFDDFMSKRK